MFDSRRGRLAWRPSAVLLTLRFAARSLARLSQKARWSGLDWQEGQEPGLGREANAAWPGGGRSGGLPEVVGRPRVVSVQRQLLSSVQKPHFSVFMTADGVAAVDRLVRGAGGVTLLLGKVVKSVSRPSFSLETSLTRSVTV